MTPKRAVETIEREGVILVFPINNRREPKSLWYDFYPKTEMRWEWDDNGDQRVASLWHLREGLSKSKKVVYSKWYQGRATFFSKTVFSELLSAFGVRHDRYPSISKHSEVILGALLENSPQSTKELKATVGMKGRSHEAQYQKALKELWKFGLIVGYGEVDDGAFPSLAMGATCLMFDDVLAQAEERDRETSTRNLRRRLANSPFLKSFESVLAETHAPQNKNSSREIKRKVIKAEDLMLPRSPQKGG